MLKLEQFHFCACKMFQFLDKPWSYSGLIFQLLSIICGFEMLIFFFFPECIYREHITLWAFFCFPVDITTRSYNEIKCHILPVFTLMKNLVGGVSNPDARSWCFFSTLCFGKLFFLCLDSRWFTAEYLPDIKGPIKMKDTYWDKFFQYTFFNNTSLWGFLILSHLHYKNT